MASQMAEMNLPKSLESLLTTATAYKDKARTGGRTEVKLLKVKYQISDRMENRTYSSSSPQYFLLWTVIKPQHDSGI